MLFFFFTISGIFLQSEMLMWLPGILCCYRSGWCLSSCVSLWWFNSVEVLVLSHSGVKLSKVMAGLSQLVPCDFKICFLCKSIRINTVRPWGQGPSPASTWAKSCGQGLCLFAEMLKWHILPPALIKWGLNYLRSTWTLRSMLKHTYT